MNTDIDIQEGTQQEQISPLFSATQQGVYAKYIKRPLDIFLSLFALIILSPLLLIVAFLVRVKLGPPIIFKQERPGKDEKIFSMYKFRTMTNKRDENGELLPDTDRLTKFGKFLRSSSLDEFLELINILTGDMSIVGPRPLLVKYLPYYTDVERKRHNVRPGLTGLAQINGRNAATWTERFSYDIEYTQGITFYNDIKIFFQTIVVALKRKDILVGEENIIYDLDVERNENVRTEVIV